MIQIFKKKFKKKLGGRFSKNAEISRNGSTEIALAILKVRGYLEGMTMNSKVQRFWGRLPGER